MKSDISKILIRPPAANIILSIFNAKERTFSLRISNKINVTYSHVTKLLNVMKKAGLIISTLEGRNKYLFLTEKGNNVANLILALREQLTI